MLDRIIEELRTKPSSDVVSDQTANDIKIWLEAEGVDVNDAAFYIAEYDNLSSVTLMLVDEYRYWATMNGGA